MPAEPALRCTALSVDYPGVRALDGVELSVQCGEVVTMLGASASGKSTLLHAVAGLRNPSAGEIWLAGRKVADVRRSVAPERRDIGLVFQDFALWPHLNCLDTVAYPLRRAGVAAAAARTRAGELLDQLGIGGLADRRPAELSGGQQQRVGLARALARDPQLFLLDEPTAHLDTHLRVAFQESVRERRATTGAAAIYATHDAGEALALADRVALIVAGRLMQIGTPQAVYAEPVDTATAQLTGPGTIVSVGATQPRPGLLSLEFGRHRFEVAGGGLTDARAAPRRVLIRPEWVQPRGALRARVLGLAFRGPHTDYLLDTPLGRLSMRVAGPPTLAVGAVTNWGLTRAWVLPDQPHEDPASVERDDRARLLEPAIDHLEV